MIKAIFYARFDLAEGPTIRHAFPRHCISLPFGFRPAQTNDAGHNVKENRNVESFQNTRNETEKIQNMDKSLFDFSLISDYVIPRQEFCGQMLSLSVKNYKIIGYPICIVSEERYERNEFNYNFCVVIEDSEEKTVHEADVYEHTLSQHKDAFSDAGRDVQAEPNQGKDISAANLPALEALVQKIALATLEAENTGQWLSLDQKEVWTKKARERPEEADGGPEDGWFDENGIFMGESYEPERILPNLFEGHSAIEAAIYLIWHQINSFGACDVNLGNTMTLHHRIDTLNHTDLEIKSRYVPVHSFHSTAPPWHEEDLTLSRLLRSINGVNSVRDVAREAGTQELLSQQGLIDLSHTGVITFVDKFLYGGIYATTPLAKSLDIYTLLSRSTVGLSIDDTTTDEVYNDNSTFGVYASDEKKPTGGNGMEKLTPEELRTLYWQYRHGLSVESWVLQNYRLLSERNIDTRSFIIRGLLAGVLVRIHKWPTNLSSLRRRESQTQHGNQERDSLDVSRGGAQPEFGERLDGTNCLDDFCTLFGSSEADVVRRIRKESLKYEMIFK